MRFPTARVSSTARSVHRSLTGWAHLLPSSTAKRLGLRLERLENVNGFVDDDSTKTPDILLRFGAVPGMISDRRGLLYYLLAYSCSIPGDIVEIGCWQGRSTLFFAQACEDTNNGVVHAIDTFKGNPGNEKAYRVSAEDLSDLESRFRMNMLDAGLAHRVVVHAKDSAEAAGEVHSQVRQARLICIDGEHTLAAVRLDLENYTDLLAPGGLLVFDDYSPRFDGVVRAIREHLASHQYPYTRAFQDSNLLVVQRHDDT